jgi:hypothetical protein
MRRAFRIGVIVILLIVISGTAALQSTWVDTWLFRQAVRHAIGGKPELASAHELAVLLVGTGTPLPDVSRAGPSTLIAAGDHLPVDAGVDCARNLQLWKIPLDMSHAIFITHLHSGHIGGLAGAPTNLGRGSQGAACLRTRRHRARHQRLQRGVCDRLPTAPNTTVRRWRLHRMRCLWPCRSPSPDPHDHICAPGSVQSQSHAVRGSMGQQSSLFHRFDFAGRSVTVSGGDL